MTTKVLFRVWNSGVNRQVDAYFPEEIMDYEGHISSYTRIGQHSAVDLNFCLENSIRASLDEYKDLLKELKEVGYDDLEIISDLSELSKINPSFYDYEPSDIQ